MFDRGFVSTSARDSLYLSGLEGLGFRGLGFRGLVLRPAQG